MALADVQEFRLVLGTAQLGMAYGIANRVGKPDQEAATAIVRAAWQHGVREFDTAQGYGDSEAVLGRAMAALGIAGEARIITKITLPRDRDEAQHLRQAVQASLARLGVGRLYGLMLHREDELDRLDAGLGRHLRQLVEDGLVERLGISVYSAARARQMLACDGIEIVQIPANMLDRRFEQAAVFEEAARVAKTVYVRSVYLQGLLLMAEADLAPAMAYAAPVLRKVVAMAAEAGVSRGELAMMFVASAYPRAKIVVGVETPAQMETNVRVMEGRLPGNAVARIRDVFRDVDEKVLNPSLWPAP